jgi:hypothetical protein
VSVRLQLRRDSGWLPPDGFEKACRCFSELHRFFVDVLLLPRDFLDAERPDAGLAAGFDLGTTVRFAADLLLTRLTAERAGAAFLALGLPVVFALDLFAVIPFLLCGFGFASDVVGFSA